MRTVRTRGLVALVIAFAACTPACSREDRAPLFSDRAVIHLADAVHGARRVGGVGTGSYPRVYVAGETREVCSDTARELLPGTLFARDLEPRNDVVIDFAFALNAGESFAAMLDLSLAATSGGNTEIVYTRTLDGAAGDYGRWHDESVGLPDGTTRIEFFAVVSPVNFNVPAGERGPSLHLACPVLTVPSATRSRRNVVLVSLDTLRADRLGIYGYGRPTSPHMDEIFGTGGFVFRRAIAPASNTLRSHAGMLTGLQPILSVEHWHEPKLARLGSLPTLADYLRAAGYRTAAFTENGFVSDVTFRFGQGFEIFNERKGVSGNVHNAGTSEETFRRGLAWLASHARQPRFLFLHTYEVHSPYRPKREHRDRFPTPPGAPQPRIDSDLYDAEIAQVDQVVGALVRSLREMRLLDDTILVVTSDHGEEFGEHGGRYHGANLYDEILRVPLMVLAPGLARGGVHHEGEVGLIDIVPTLLDLVGIDVPPYLTGRSRAGSITGEAANGAAATESAPLFSEGVAPEAMTYGGPDPDWRSPSLAATRWPHRLIRYDRGGRIQYELYDLRSDPHERHSLTDEIDASPELRELRDALDRYRDDGAERSRALASRLRIPGAPADAPALQASGTPPTESQAPAELTLPDRQREELRALGYVD